MIEVTESFKDAARAPVKTIRAKITCDGHDYTSADDFVSLTKEDIGNYFGVATKSLSFKLLGTAYNLIGKTAEVSFEIETENDWESCTLGQFIIYEQTVNLEKDTTDFKAYDQMGVMGKVTYEAGNLTFPCTVENLFEQISDRFGLARYATNVANLSYEIAEDLYARINGTTFRDILAEIAGATASLCEVTENSIKLRPIEMSPIETLTYANLKKAKLEPKYGPVNSVVLARTPTEDNIIVTDEESIAENGRTEIKLANNEILDDNREVLAQPILDEVDGFYYYPFEITTEGHGWYEIGDRLAITDGTNTWEIIVSSISLSIGNGMKETLKGVAPNETQTNYALAGGITKTIYNTEIKVDKQGQTIESIVEEQNTLENQVNENYTTITQSISNVITSVQNSGGNNLIRNSAMYSLDDSGLPLLWTLSGTGTITIAPSAEAAVNGSLLRQNISLKNKTISQIIEVKADNSSITQKTYYSFSCKIKKTAVALTATINDDGISAPKARFRNEINMSPIKIVPQSDGWAFVRSID